LLLASPNVAELRLKIGVTMTSITRSSLERDKFLRRPVVDVVPTPKELIERARRLQPQIRAEAAEAERRGFYSTELNALFCEAGFHRLLTPRKYGGYELDVASFYAIMVEIAVGDPATGWCLGLGASVALYATSYFPAEAQDQIFSDGPDFIAPLVGKPEMPGGTASAVPGGYRVSGKWRYSSGVPYSNYFLGFVEVVGESVAERRVATVIVPHGDYTVLDDWGGMLGQRASGSNTVVIEEAVIPPEFVLFDTTYGETSVQGSGKSPVHENPMYRGMFAPFGTGVLVCTQVGAAKAALAEFERIARATRPHFAQHLFKYEHHDWQRIFGLALSMTSAAEILLIQSGEMFMAQCRAQAAGERGTRPADAMRLVGIQHQAARLSWEAGIELFRSAGSSSAMDGEPMQRFFRDLATFRTNANHQLDFTATNIGRVAFGLPLEG
jgi:3-hydroxy-9,10-secoandrosta-1,3,5(10)-triene-9,17-dione monooxygenase